MPRKIGFRGHCLQVKLRNEIQFKSVNTKQKKMIADSQLCKLISELEVPPLLPPRQKLRRPNSPWHDVPKNNRPVLPPEDPIPPPLPIKTKNCKTHQVLIKIEQDSSSSIEQSLASSEFDSVLCQPPSQNSDQKLEDLDTLLVQLSEVNTSVLQQIDLSQGRCVQSSLVQVRPSSVR